MASWAAAADTEALEGVRIQFSCCDGGVIVQASSDAMPPDGEQVFAQLKRILLEYASKENRI